MESEEWPISPGEIEAPPKFGFGEMWRYGAVFARSPRSRFVGSYASVSVYSETLQR
jgi:hypothetical protein